MSAFINSWCQREKLWYALLMRANKPQTAVQSSIFFLLASHGLISSCTLVQIMVNHRLPRKMFIAQQGYDIIMQSNQWHRQAIVYIAYNQYDVIICHKDHMILSVQLAIYLSFIEEILRHTNDEHIDHRPLKVSLHRLQVIRQVLYYTYVHRVGEMCRGGSNLQKFTP